MKELESLFEDFYKQAGKQINAQSININFNTSPSLAFFFCMLMNDALNGKNEVYKFLNEKGKDELLDITQNILDQVANKTKFKSAEN